MIRHEGHASAASLGEVTNLAQVAHHHQGDRLGPPALRLQRRVETVRLTERRDHHPGWQAERLIARPQRPECVVQADAGMVERGDRVGVADRRRPAAWSIPPNLRLGHC